MSNNLFFDSFREVFKDANFFELVCFKIENNPDPVIKQMIEDEISRRRIQQSRVDIFSDILKKFSTKEDAFKSMNASLTKRFFAAIIDLTIAIVLFTLSNYILELMNIVHSYIPVFLLLGYFSVKDFICNGQSFGKRALGLVVVNFKNGLTCDLAHSIFRNSLYLAAPYGFYAFITAKDDKYRQSLIDKLTGTFVMNKDFLVT